MPMAVAAIPALPPMQTPVSDAFARDAIIAWFRGEFAAANAIIDALCGHLAQLGGGYEGVFEAVHRRRVNWIPVLQMQKYYSIADVAVELGRVAAAFSAKKEEAEEGGGGENECVEEEGTQGAEEEDSPNSDTTDSGSHEMQPASEQIVEICENHDHCEARAADIKLTKGFTAKEPVKGHMVNVVKGLKLYENVFSDLELAKLAGFVNEVRAAGHNGELSGDTFILFNQRVKGNKRELIQFGVPIFGHVQEESPSDNKTSNLEPIPALLQRVIDHLVEWQLIPIYKKPNSCIISFFDEGEYSQPFLKPPHLGQPISTILLSDSTMVFGRFLVSDDYGNYKGPLMLSLKEGSLLVMRGNSADMARHVMCPRPNKRVAITFFRVRPECNQVSSPTATSPTGAMTLWQPGNHIPSPTPNGTLSSYEALDLTGVLCAPVVMLASPVRPMVLSPKKIQQGGGTGVFLPWAVSPRKPVKHLPPRAQRGRFLALQSSGEGNRVSP